jgi:hypothetical protein
LGGLSVRKSYFLPIFHIENDQFTKTVSKKNPFLLAENLGLASAGLSVSLSDAGTVDSASFVLGGVGTRTPFGGSHVYMKPINFYQDRLGTNIGKVEGEGVFAQDPSRS